MQARFDEIATFLDAENSVTTRWLAHNLDVTLDTAREGLKCYSAKDSAATASFLVVGERTQGSLSFVVTRGTDLDAVRGSFKSIVSEELYALHKVQSEANTSEIQFLEFEQGAELLMMTHPSSSAFLKNSAGYICCPDIEVKPLGQRILSSAHVPAAPLSSAKEVAKGTIAKAATEVKSAPAPVALKSKSSIQATNFFGASATAAVKTEKTPAPAVVKPEPVVRAAEAPLKAEIPEVKEEKTASKRVGRVVDDEDEEWDSGYKPDPARLKERVDATAAARRDFQVGATDEEEQNTPESKEPEDAEQGEEGAAAGAAGGAKRKGKAANVAVHGAMDDYFEDVAIAEHHRSEAAPADAPKPKKRKLVEKMYADEKGYLVTSMVWEDVTDDEGDAGIQPDSVKRAKHEGADKENGDAAAGNREKKAAPAPAAAAKPAKKVAAEAPKAGQQKSMMSFFGKKA